MPESASPSPTDALLGRVAVAAKMISMEQLAQATREQARLGNAHSLGDVLVAMGFITKPVLAKAIELQNGVIARAKEKRTTPPVATPAPELGAESDARAARDLARQARPHPGEVRRQVALEPLLGDGRAVAEQAHADKAIRHDRPAARGITLTPGACREKQGNDNPPEPHTSSNPACLSGTVRRRLPVAR